ncbi:mannose-6-phosphate isomerase, class I [Peribacillus kribbensis]|uniref:mannose-6-phosphate isomerase, class I n=1 Tax=Peribacillus kribbensis TaxID=356658 RepID=UPI00047DF6D5|nr:mannose-6-phosphate isomerase, class I [Peribacillus kribbensis]
MEPLFFKPVFKQRIWGGTALKEEFGYEISNAHTGECWAISAHPNGPSLIENGMYAGMALDSLWSEHPELFGNSKEKVFPMLTKILDANQDLSVQVHPDDAYARVHENGEQGKTECWYIIDCKEDADIILGHHARSKEEFMQQIKEGRWSDLLRRVKVKPGDFFYVPSGTIHAICEGTLILETQQSSDTTYRIYDYERRDSDGNLRDLHLEKAIDVITIPYQNPKSTSVINKNETSVLTSFLESGFFSVYKWQVRGIASFNTGENYLLLSVIKGNGILFHHGGEYPIKKGTHFILPFGFGEFEIDGECELIVSHT